MTAKQADAIRNRLDVLRRIINLDSTPDGEKAAAAHMARKLQAKLDAANVSDPETRRGGSRYYQLPEVVYGAKYAETAHLSTTQIAKLIRQEIALLKKLAKKKAKPGEVKFADPIGDAPAGTKISVRSESFSGGSAIRIGVTGFPEEWGWHPVEHPYPHQGATRALGELGIALYDLMNAYNFDGSDSQVDYFHVRFYDSVSSDHGSLPKWEGHLCRCHRCAPEDWRY
jgi:hypothetical protein